MNNTAADNRTKVLYICVISLAILLVVAVGVSLWMSDKAITYERTLQGLYQKGYSDFANSTQSMYNSLSKLRVTNSREQSQLLLADVSRLSSEASDSISSLPTQFTTNAKLNSFVNQVGDFSQGLSKKLDSDQAWTDSDRKQLDAAAAGLKSLNDALLDVDSIQALNMSQLTNMEFYHAENGLQPPFEGKDSNIEQLPTLIYDGPFSESTQKLAPKGLGDAVVDEEQAAAIASAFLGGGSPVQRTDGESGSVETFGFTGTLASGESCTIQVTKQGGRVLWMMSEQTDYSEVENADALQEEAYTTAQGYLEARGFSGLEPNYWQSYNGIAVINFAATQDDVVLYSDLIKVWVDLRSKQVVGVNAQNYLFSHTARQLAAPKLSEDEARKHLRDGLTADGGALCLIPMDDNTEKLCYEFVAMVDNEDYLIYINADTGAEEQLLRVLHAPGGELVM